MRDLFLNFSLCVLRVRQLSPSLSNVIVELTKSFDLLQMKVCSSAPGLRHQFSREHRRQALLLSLVPTILHERIENHLNPSTRRQQKRYPPVVNPVRRNGSHDIEDLLPECHRRASHDGMFYQNVQCVTGRKLAALPPIK